MRTALTLSMVPSVPFFTPRLRSFLQEHDAVARGEVASPRSVATGGVLAKLARNAQPLARSLEIESRTSSLVWVRMIREAPGAG
jgi:hypothetical protein